MERLRELSCIIYLAASKEYYSEMLERYIKRPRPVLWGTNLIKDNWNL